MAAKRIEQKRKKAHYRPRHNQRMQPDDPQYKKSAETHAHDAIVVSVRDHKARKTEKEVDSQKAVTDKILARIGVYPFHEVK